MLSVKRLLHRTVSYLNSSITGFASLSNKEQVLDFVKKGSFILLHFATHSGFNVTNPDDSAIQLFGVSLRLSCIQDCFLFPRPRPLIFINACEGAKIGFSFTRLSGWAESWVKKAEVCAFAGAFADAMWEVQDALA